MNLHLAPQLEALHVISALPHSLNGMADHYSHMSDGDFSLYPDVESILVMLVVEACRTKDTFISKEANIATKPEANIATKSTSTTRLDYNKPGTLACLVRACTGIHWLKDCHHHGTSTEHLCHQALKDAKKPTGNIASADKPSSIVPTIPKPMGDLARLFGEDWPEIGVQGYVGHIFLLSPGKRFVLD